MKEKAKKKTRKTVHTIIISIALTALLIIMLSFTNVTLRLDYKIYDFIMRCEYELFHKRVTSDIVLITIDNKTLTAMTERWPYPRSKFAKVIDNLKKAGAKVIAFDFIFFGASTPEEDARLKISIAEAGNVVLGEVIDEEGKINTSSDVLGRPECGIVTKFQCVDGVIRKNLTYMVSGKDSANGIVFWELKILKTAKYMDLTSLSDEGTRIKFSSPCGEELEIPVDAGTKSYMIHFRAHTNDFNILSFSDVLDNNFNAACVNGKIALMGMASTILGDIHNTPIGWLPGLTVNANAFLTLYNHDFIRKAPRIAGILFAVFGVTLNAWVLSVFGFRKTALVILAEMFLFLTVSILLLVCGFMWDYSLFPIAVLLCPILGWQLRRKLQTKNYWT